MGRHERLRGNREERAILEWFREHGVDGRRTAASGAQDGHDGDIELCLLGVIHVEVKKRRNGGGFVQLEKWLGDNDMLVLRRNRKEPMFVLTADLLGQLLERVVDWEELMLNAEGTALAMEGEHDGEEETAK